MSSIAKLATKIKSEKWAGVLNGRLEAAERLATGGAVSQVNPNTWTVASQSRPGQTYQVTFNLGWACTCKDFDGSGYHPAPVVEFFGGVGPVCKHIGAAALCWASGQYPAPSPEPAGADLVIVTRRVVKFHGQTQSNDGRVLWWKLAGQEKQAPRLTARLTDPSIQTRLKNYELVQQKCSTTEIWHFYRLAGAQTGGGLR